MRASRNLGKLLAYVLTCSTFAAGFATLTTQTARVSRNHAPRPSTPAVKESSAPAEPVSEETRARAGEAYMKLPLSFEENRGQVGAGVRYVSRGAGYTLFLTPAEAVLSLRSGGQAQSKKEGPRPHQPRAASRKQQSAVLRMKLRGACAAPAVSGEKEISSRTNYFIGNDPKKWHTDVASYERVRYSQVYPGVDVIYYGRQEQLEYDFEVAPGADAGQIVLEFAGVKRVSVERGTGDLVLATANGEVRQRRPVAYQEAGGERREVKSRYVMRGEREVGIEVGEYDRTKRLVLDPVLTYSTYLGGHGSDWVNDIAVDPAGNIYAVGATDSPDFPLTNSSPLATYYSAFMVKLNPKLSGAAALLYSAFLGGTNDDEALGIALDPAGNVYLTGVTTSFDFPVKKALDPDGKYYDAFVMKLNPNLTGEASLLYSTYLGGTSYDTGYAIAADSAGMAYVTGFTVSADFPKKNHFRTRQGGDDPGSNDVFVTKLDTNVSGWAGLLYSTYISGSANDKGYGIAVDAAGNIYVAGSTDSPNFPVKNQYQSFHECIFEGFGCGDGFLTKLNPNLSGSAALLYSTYIGDYYMDYCTGVGLDAAGHVYVAGVTTTMGFPFLNGYLEKLDTSFDAFVMKLDTNIPGEAGLLYATALGGPDLDYCNDMAVDPTGVVYLTGYSFSLFPLKDEYQGDQDGDLFTDAFVAKLDTNIPGEGGLIFSTYLGGSESDSGVAVAFDGSGNVYVAGETDSPDFPKKNYLRARQDSAAGINDSFIAVLTEPVVISGRVTSDGTTGVGGVTMTLSGSQNRIVLTNSTGGYSFGGLVPGGNYAVTPSKGALVFIPSRRSFTDLREDQTGANFTTRRAAISGRVTIGTATGAALGGVTVTLTGGTGFPPRTVSTSSTGAYLFGNIPTPGNYRVTPSKLNYNFNPTQTALLNLTANQTETNFVATLKSYTVSGMVKLGGVGLGGVKVMLASPLPAGFSTRTATTDSAGAYAFTNVPPARSYTVTPTKTGYQFVPAGRSLFDLSASQTAVNFSVKVYSVRGRVTAAGTTTGVFEATMTMSSPVPAGFPARIVHTDYLGYYTFQNLPAGRNYTLKPTLTDFTFSPASRSFTNLSGNIPVGASTSFTGTSP